MRRLAFAVLVLVTLAAIDYGLYRALRPDEYGGEGLIEGLAGDLGRVLLHFDFGDACMFPGCPPIREIWGRVVAAPFGAVCLRLTLAAITDVLGADHVRTAEARDSRVAR